ncbi:MAG TPA: HAMP domain-containing protein [Nocardioidaceae bacterium]|nr:HAMP domain-containing protein [Nocardioidaceae bacterium]
MARSAATGTAAGRSAGRKKTVSRPKASAANGNPAAPAAAKSARESGVAPDANGKASPEAVALAELTAALVAARDGDFHTRLPVRGPGAEAAIVFNELAARNEHLAKELERVRRVVGRDGRLNERLRPVPGGGSWAASVDAANSLIDDLVRPTAEVGRVIAAVAQGDLSQTLDLEIDGQPIRGEFLRMGRTVNKMVNQLSLFTSEVTRVAREVGTEGRLGSQARVRGVSGSWKDLTDSVNYMAGRLTAQVRDIALVTTAVAEGDLSRKVTVEVAGEMLQLKLTVNQMVDTLSDFADQVTRVAREVGTEGQLGAQADVKGVAGTWKDLTDSVNVMASNLTSQVRDISMVAGAIARGDLSRQITVNARGEIAALADTLNSTTATLQTFADEVTRVAKEVGTEGRLGGQAEVPGVSGTWKDLTDSVNVLAGNLTGQVRNIAQVTTAVARGDLSQKITVDARGEILELKSTVNTMVDQLSSFADEVTRVAKEVGTEGRLGGQAEVAGVSGTWRDLTDSVNVLASNLTDQVRNIAQVTTAVARGDLSQKITVDARGEILELKSTVNTMVDQLSAFAEQVTRVAKEVGTEGRLGGQAEVPGVSGTWRDLTDSVNVLASNLTGQVRNIAQVTTAVARGDLSQKISVDVKGELLELKSTVNTMVDQLSSFADEVTRVSREVGTEGRLGGQAHVRGVSGTWKDLTENVNFMANNLTEQVRSIASVSSAVARGDLSQKINVEAKGEIAALAETINGMVDTLRTFADEVTRVSREVGTEGRLGGQAQVPNVSGTWKNLTDSVNFMANNLTEQVRSIAKVTTAVANGDLSQKIYVDARGEILELKTTINSMVDQLSSFASEVTRVAREVGTEGRLGGQAEVGGISGTWRRLTESVNELASSLTTQLRAIADVATAVTHGDLSRQVTVNASGEVAQLKDRINQMIDNLRDTTLANQEQDWLKTNLARLSGQMQGKRDLKDVARLLMSELTPMVSAQHGAFFLAAGEGDATELRLIASYGYEVRKSVANRFKVGESLVGQAALEKKPIMIVDAPSDYVRISSGLGSAPPANIIVLPVLFEDQLLAVIELASFGRITEVHRTFLDQLMESVGITLNTIIANSRTEELLSESQRLAHELQAQQEQLQQSNVDLSEKAALLADQNRAIEIKNVEIEQARSALEERAEQLALSSRYKSEFLANMSHELRTPLNSMLILAKLLVENPDKNLSPQQVEFAETIHSAGSDLLQLINDILDLAKVEAGKMELRTADVSVTGLVDYVEATFRPLAADKRLGFRVAVDADVPPTVRTDEQRLQQVLRNLLSNAIKFTDHGEVQLHLSMAHEESFDSEVLRKATAVLAASVVDTGIGISEDRLPIIFEAFQQAEGTIDRRFGGTGLGLSISREIANMLGGEIHVESTMGVGSTFTLYLPTYREDDSEPPSGPHRSLEAPQDVLVATLPARQTAEPAKSSGSSKATKPSKASKPAAPSATAVPAVESGLARRPRLLLVEESEEERHALTLQAGDQGAVEVTAVATLEEARAAIEGDSFDQIVLNPRLTGGSGLQLLESFATGQVPVPPPVLLYTPRPLPKREQVRLERYGKVLSISTASSRTHVVEALREAWAGAYVSPPADGLNAPTSRIVTEGALTLPGRKALVIDDDVRSVFALVNALELRKLHVMYAESGLQGIDLLKKHGDFDLVLMDIMMPEMDGYTAIRRIRSTPQFASLPIIAVSAKAMRGDREKSLAAGASDHVTKPVDVEHLVALMGTLVGGGPN